MREKLPGAGVDCTNRTMPHGSGTLQMQARKLFHDIISPVAVRIESAIDSSP